jgi:hypothetical protein
MGTVGILGAAGVVYDGGTGYIPVRNAASTPDGGAGTWFPPALGAVYNETTFDRLRGVVARPLLASAERTATTSSADQTNYNWRGIRVDTNISAITDAGAEIVVALQAKDPVSGNYIVLVQTVALNTTGQKAALIAFPGAIVAANEVANTLVPRTWNVKVTHTDAKRISYSVVCSLIP